MKKFNASLLLTRSVHCLATSYPRSIYVGACLSCLLREALVTDLCRYSTNFYSCGTSVRLWQKS